MQKVFEFTLEIVGWLAIVASPFFAATAIGLTIYLNRDDTVGFYIGTSIPVIGLIQGVIWATTVWKKHGTFEYISRIYGTPKSNSKPVSN